MIPDKSINIVDLRINYKTNIEIFEGGKIWKVVDSSGDETKIHFDRPMPDGTRLTSNNNSHFLDAMQSSLSSAWEGEDRQHSVTSVDSLRKLVANQYGWIYWLVDHGRHRLEDVQIWDIEAYFSDCAQGTVAAFGAREKIRKSLRRLKDCGVNIAEIRFSDVLGESHLYFNRWLKGVVDEVRDEILNGGATEVRSRNGNVSESSLFGKGVAITLLHRLCLPGQTRLGFDPEEYVADALSTKETATPIGTRLIPMEAAMRLMDQAARWIISVAPVLLDFRGRLIDLYKLKESLSREEYARRRHALLEMVNADLEGLLPGPLTFDKRSKSGGLHVRSVFVRMLPAASYTCVGTLSGRRDKEIKSLRRGACSGTEASGYWLESYIGKNPQADQRTPCSRLIVDAVALLEEYGSLGTDGCERGKPAVMLRLRRGRGPPSASRDWRKAGARPGKE